MNRQVASLAASALASVAASVDASAPPSRPASVRAGGVTTPPRSPGSSPAAPGVVSSHATTTSAKLATTATSKVTKRLSTSAMLSRVLGGLGVAVTLALVGCSSTDGNVVDDADRPGSRVIAGIIACRSDADCQSGESCGKGFCQMKRCGGTYASLPPLGLNGYAYLDRAFMMAGDTRGIRALSPYATGDRAQLTVSAAPADVAGGNFTGERPEGVAFVITGSSNLSLAFPGKEPVSFPIGFAGKRVAAGDVTGDGLDEIVVLGEGGAYAVCNAIEKSCKKGTVPVAATDVTVGDVDGDGVAEALFLSPNLISIVEAASGKAKGSQPVKPVLVSLAAGDLDGDGKVEVFGAEDTWGTSADVLHVFKLGATLAPIGELPLDYTITNDALDVAFTKQDDKPRIGVLASSSKLVVAEVVNGAVKQVSSTNVSGAKRLSAADVVGRSALVKLKNREPVLEVGPPVPIAVLTLPPYSATYSQGPSSATLGTTEESSTAESHGSSKTVSLSLGGGLGLPPNPLTGAIGAGFSVFVSNTWAQTASRQVSKNISLSIGNSYTVTAEPQVDGYNSGGVVLGGGCFHRFDYDIDDPERLAGANTPSIQTFVPVGGETSLWSTRRYNALVDAIGDGRLPKVEIPMKLGTVASYPAAPVTLEGTPIADEDNVFKKSPVTRSSDVGTVGFSLTVNDSTTNTDATAFNYSRSISVSGNIGLVSGQASQDTNWGLDQSYSVTLGTSASFSGQIGPVRDDPGTPANEATVYGYSFNPLVYRHHFKAKDGKDGAYYVLTYTAGQ